MKGSTALFWHSGLLFRHAGHYMGNQAILFVFGNHAFLWAIHLTIVFIFGTQAFTTRCDSFIRALRGANVLSISTHITLSRLTKRKCFSFTHPPMNSLQHRHQPFMSDPVRIGAIHRWLVFYSEGQLGRSCFFVRSGVSLNQSTVLAAD